MFKSILVIGLGLIGSSLVHDIRTHRLAKRVIGIDPDLRGGKEMLGLNLLDAFFEDAANCTEQAELVIIATPPATYESLAPQLAKLVKDGGLVIDTGSVKQHAILTLSTFLPGSVTFVPCHPIAGSERSGIGSGSSGLFLHRRVILTPYREDRQEETARIIRFWESLGAQCEGMAAEEHDHLYAYMSHLPQLAAYASALTLAEHTSSLPPALNQYLRIAASSPALWRDILSHNAVAVLEALDYFIFVIGHILAELAEGAPPEATFAADPEAATELLPRVVASSLISTVALTERKENKKFARYAGQGFRDMTELVQTSPEADIERISHAYGQVAQLLGNFEMILREWAGMMRAGHWDELQQRFKGANTALDQMKGLKH